MRRALPAWNPARLRRAVPCGPRPTRPQAFRLACALGLLALGLAAQSTAAVSGTVRNATTGRPAAGVNLTLLSLTGGMQPVAHTQSDANGNFRFAGAPGGNAPLMVQADYAGVPYFQPLQAGQPANDVAVTVYNASPDAHQIQLEAEIAVVQPEQGDLAVVDEYSVQNQLTPPRTLYQAGGLFRFRAPANATVDGVRVVGASGMPVDSTPTKTGEPGVYGVDFPLRPGKTAIQVSYRVPYPGLKATLTETPIYPTGQFEVYVPEPMTLQSPGFVQLGEQKEGNQDYRVYGPQGPSRPGASIAYSLAGDAPVPSDTPDAGAGSGAGAAGTASSGASAAAATPASSGETAAPEPKTFMERNLWTVLAMLALAAAAGFGMLWSQPRTAPAGVPVGTLAPAAATQPAAASPAIATMPQADPATVAGTAPGGLDQLKNDLLLLELRRVGGNVDDAEYLRLRRELDDRLRRLLGLR